MISLWPCPFQNETFKLYMLTPLYEWVYNKGGII